MPPPPPLDLDPAPVATQVATGSKDKGQTKKAKKVDTAATCADNKAKDSLNANQVPKKRGRPPGSKNKPKA
jgi:hypothetical protein